MARHCQQQQAEAALSVNEELVICKEQANNWKAKLIAMEAVCREKVSAYNKLRNQFSMRQVDLQEKELKIENLEKELANLKKVVNEKNYHIEQYKKDLAHKNSIIENMMNSSYVQNSLQFKISEEALSNRIGKEPVNVGCSGRLNAEQKELSQNQHMENQRLVFEQESSNSYNETGNRVHLALHEFIYQKSAEDCYQSLMLSLKELFKQQSSSIQWNIFEIIVEFLGNRRNDAMKMFMDTEDPVMLYPIAERCIARTLMSIHESNTNQLYEFPIWSRFLMQTLSKLEARNTMSIFGMAALGRVFISICIRYRLDDLPDLLMRSYMKLPSSKALYLLACIGGAFPDYFRAQRAAFHRDMEICHRNIPENVDADDQRLIRSTLFMMKKMFQ